jgi:hypothetical protein
MKRFPLIIDSRLALTAPLEALAMRRPPRNPLKGIGNTSRAAGGAPAGRPDALTGPQASRRRDSPWFVAKTVAHHHHVHCAIRAAKEAPEQVNRIPEALATDARHQAVPRY